MRYGNCGRCGRCAENAGALYNAERYYAPDCAMPMRRQLEPVLAARIYYQPIVEEIPCSAMSLTLDNTTTIANACTDVRPICDDYCGY